VRTLILFFSFVLLNFKGILKLNVEKIFSVLKRIAATETKAFLGLKNNQNIKKITAQTSKSGNAIPAKANGHHLKGSKNIAQLLMTSIIAQQMFAAKIIGKNILFILIILCNNK